MVRQRKKDQTEETYLVCSPIASLEALQLFDHFRKGVTQPLVTQSLTPLSIGPESMDQPPSKKNREKLHDILNHLLTLFRLRTRTRVLMSLALVKPANLVPTHLICRSTVNRCHGFQSFHILEQQGQSDR